MATVVIESRMMQTIVMVFSLCAARNARRAGSLADYLQEVTEETTAIPHALRYYIDWQAMARDAEMNGELFAVSTGWNATHVFAGC